ncbi:TFIIH C1-like domain containing protein [Trema orientale]|uniref:TFIIH C1-like domain containing protein n=1 Tax=Trema orientale TaxID=63057 RepID=A0A2P5EDZ8_TREOI|nr:TFIIH C1-like domain containing protein [Trema orientale]
MLEKNNNTASSSGAADPSSSSDHNHHHQNHYAFPNNSCENGVNTNSNDNNNCNSKRKRRPAGTPDPDAEVVSLSPKTLLESDRYVCEICNQGFQRDQNLQMHRRRHKVPWKLLKRETQEVKKRVFVCPEPSCLHHDPCHALGDLVGIKKHFRRKHSNHKQWVCDKCSKAYAVQSDYKAHLKTCGTRGHSCDCGRVFSRVESFIEHQDSCTVRQVRPELQALQSAATAAACSSRTASSTSPSSDANFGNIAAPFPAGVVLNMPKPTEANMFLSSSSERASTSKHSITNISTNQHQQNLLELQLLPSSEALGRSMQNSSEENYATHLKLSIGSFDAEKSELPNEPNSGTMRISNGGVSATEPVAALEVSRVRDFANEEMKLAMAEKSYAEEARREAKRQIEMAEMEFTNAKRIRQQAQAELEKAQLLREQATKKVSSTILQITCQSCKQQFQTTPSAVGGPPDETTSLAMSYMSSATTEGEGEGE